MTEAGEATTDPNAAVFGVPLGGYKGYGLALMVEVLCGVLAGAGVRRGRRELYSGGEERQNTGHFHLALDPERTVGRDAFAGVLGGLLAELRAIRRPAGSTRCLSPAIRRTARASRASGPGSRSSRFCGSSCAR